MNRSSLCIQTPLTLAHFAQLCYWHGKPCILVLWGIFPLTLNPSNSWKIFSLHRKVGLQKEHKPTKVVRYCDHPEFADHIEFQRKKLINTAAPAIIRHRHTHLHCSLACTTDSSVTTHIQSSARSGTACFRHFHDPDWLLWVLSN